MCHSYIGAEPHVANLHKSVTALSDYYIDDEELHEFQVFVWATEMDFQPLA